jgi:hypothetical protein
MTEKRAPTRTVIFGAAEPKRPAHDPDTTRRPSTLNVYGAPHVVAGSLVVLVVLVVDDSGVLREGESAVLVGEVSEQAVASKHTSATISPLAVLLLLVMAVRRLVAFVGSHPRRDWRRRKLSGTYGYFQDGSYLCGVDSAPTEGRPERGAEISIER